MKTESISRISSCNFSTVLYVKKKMKEEGKNPLITKCAATREHTRNRLEYVSGKN